jgi:broad specificity phosphatase PhoE
MLAYAIRHAESLANADQDDSLDAGLSSLGRRQVQALAERYASTRITAIYSSPFLRCLETAGPIARALNLSVRLRPELCEYHHLEPGTRVETGLQAIDTIVGRHSGVVPCPDHPGPFDWPPVDEPFAGVLARTKALATFLKSRWRDPEDTVILVSHGSPVARLIEAWLTDRPGPWFRFIIDNGALAALRYHEGVSSLVCLNEISHLRGLPSPKGANFAEDGSVRPVPASGYW